MELQVSVIIAFLVYSAFVLDFFGFLARDELWLRLLMFAASAFYLAYYYVVADAPLWDAIITNSILAAVNLFMIGIVVLERTTFAMSAETAAIYQHFKMLSPGQFRRLLKAGTRHVATHETRLTETGETPETLCYVIDGPVLIDKTGTPLRLDQSMFIGEIAFLTGNLASATVSVDAGSEYLAWDSRLLRQMLEKSPKLKIALSAQFNEDLVGKVARSIPS